jgi:hypothetical protein
MTKFTKILKHIPLKARDKKKIKKVILKTEKNGKSKIKRAYEEK